ncbi:Variant surface glycoprotein [Trypanosoma congolense IL3000]|uniref:Variant surface glycoprotein n=1 Tax=Trypanosoma congolense (strain IL3000) TaxID=1068625 RepID=F9WGG6_TRYCI|nr:Variant surface glycoprotein [Trypanosoma congolense IL3000]
MMRMLVIWVALMAVLGIGSGAGNGWAYTPDPNHNGDKHGLLCGLLGATVHKWKTTNHPGVKKALGQAIFGSTQGGWDLNKFELHPDFNKGGSRGSLCGKCLGTPDHYPGKSIPHDLLCLCTVGENGHPFTSYESITKLCGRAKNDLTAGNQNHQGWHSSNSGIAHQKNTWDKIVKPCLQGGSDASIEEALRNLTEHVGDRDYPRWEASNPQVCSGGYSTDICVRYTGCGKRYLRPDFPQWWETLEQALRTPNLTEDQLNSTTFLNASLDMDHNLDGVHGGHGVGTSSTSSQQAGSATPHPEEPSNRLLSLLSKHDGTPLTPATLWSLGAFVSWF